MVGCQRLATADEPGALEVVGSNPTDPTIIMDSLTYYHLFFG